MKFMKATPQIAHHIVATQLIIIVKVASYFTNFICIHDFIHDMLVVPFQDTHNTVLHYAAEFGHVKITDMLIEKYGMDPTTESKVCGNNYNVCTYFTVVTVLS